ncbi:hypothetical protein QT343_25540 [Escherichia coli]|nr:hypothetical protein [Escherichia coli]
MPILCCEGFISVHQYAQGINSREVIGQFLRRHLSLLGKFTLFLLPMPAARATLFPGARRLAVSAEKILPDFSKIRTIKKALGGCFPANIWRKRER